MWVEWRKRQRAEKRDRGRLSSEREVGNEQRREEIQERKEGSTCMEEVKTNMERNGEMVMLVTVMEKHFSR